VIELRSVALAIGGRTLLAEVDLVIARGEFVAVLGRNGVGKTTLLRAIAGLHSLTAGELVIDGIGARHLSIGDRARRIALIASDDTFFEALLVRDVVSIGRFAHGPWWQWQHGDADERAIDAAIAAVEMEDFARRHFATLSAGERQRIWIALGLAQETPILLLDEPTSHLDPAAAATILTLLRRLSAQGKTVVCALHDVNEATAYADRVACLGPGRLLATVAADSLFDGELLRRTYGVAFERRRAMLPVGRRTHEADIGSEHPTSDAV
jgi:iron complex transport system ATP-binding protein